MDIRRTRSEQSVILLPPPPKHPPGRHELLDHAGGRQIEKANLVGERFVLVPDEERTQFHQVVFKPLQLFLRPRVVFEVGRPGHRARIAYSLLFRPPVLPYPLYPGPSVLESDAMGRLDKIGDALIGLLGLGKSPLIPLTPPVPKQPSRAISERRMICFYIGHLEAFDWGALKSRHHASVDRDTWSNFSATFVVTDIPKENPQILENTSCTSDVIFQLKPKFSPCTMQVGAAPSLEAAPPLVTLATEADLTALLKKLREKGLARAQELRRSLYDRVERIREFIRKLIFAPVFQPA